jgi:hypothetical protein
MPPGAARDSAIWGCALCAALFDPKTATEWVAQISDASRRRSATESVANYWKVTDRISAEQWLEKMRSENFGEAKP